MKLIQVVKLFVQGGVNQKEDCVPCKVWLTTTKETQAALRKGDNTRTRIVKYDAVYSGNPGGGKLYSQPKNNEKSCCNLPEKIRVL